MMMTDAGILGVETVEEHEDGSATYKFHMDAHCRGLLAEEGLKLVLYCAAANMDMQLVYDFIEDHIRYEKDELTEYEFGTKGHEPQKCVSCGNVSATDFCEFCLREE
jgi:hypothetical protein